MNGWQSFVFFSILISTVSSSIESMNFMDEMKMNIYAVCMYISALLKTSPLNTAFEFHNVNHRVTLSTYNLL